MTWAFVGAAAISVATSAYAGSQSAKGAARQASAASKAENEAIIEANTKNMARNAYRVGLMNLQLGQSKARAVQAGFDRTVQAKQVLGAITANQAASGNVGASVDAVVTDVQMRLGEAEAAAGLEQELTLIDFNNDLDAMVMQADDATLNARKYEYHGPSSADIWKGALVSTLGQFGAQYAARKMSLGLGQPPQADTTPRKVTAGGGGFAWD